MSGESSLKPVINLANSIVGVSILAIPYCFSQCGVVLGSLLVLFTALMTIWSCKMLIRAANMTRSHTYETLALAVFSKTGKLVIEISIIALNIGTCIAYFVIIGDLAPPILAKLIGIHMTPGTFRAVLLILSALFVAFPLGLLRNIDSLSAVSISSLIFYFSLTAEVVYLSTGNLRSGVWRSNVVWWNNEGILKCLPIISLAFACHTQMFVIYSSLHDPGVRRMSGIAEKAVWLIFTIYIVVGLFGYVTYCNVEVKGDILANFSLSLCAQLTRLGFSLSVVLSFPLMIFPCRASIYSLFFSQAPNELHVQEPIPHNRFIAITAGIVGSTVVIAILIPNIETVLALTGATTGSLICFIFPGFIFLKVAGSSADFSNRAKLVLVIGLVSMVLSTAVVIHTESTRQSTDIDLPVGVDVKEPPDIVKLPPVDVQPDDKIKDKEGGIQDEGGGVDEERRKEPALPKLPPVEEGDDHKKKEVDKNVEKPIEQVKPANPGGPVDPGGHNVIDIPPDGGEGKHEGQELSDKNEKREEAKKEPGEKEPVKQDVRQEKIQNEKVEEGGKEREGGDKEREGEGKAVEGEIAHERIEKHLEKLNDRVEKLEQENQQLREKQEVIERIQIRQGDEEEEQADQPVKADKIEKDDNNFAKDESLVGRDVAAGGDKAEQAVLEALEKENKENEQVADNKREHVALERRAAEGGDEREDNAIAQGRNKEEKERKDEPEENVEIPVVHQMEEEELGDNAGNIAAPAKEGKDQPPVKDGKKDQPPVKDGKKDQPPVKDGEKAEPYRKRDILHIKDSTESK